MAKDELIDEHVSARQCKLAVNALLKHAAKVQEKREQTELLSGKEQHVWLVLTVKQMHTEKKLKPFQIPIVHPLVDPRTSPVCLITKDPQREYKDLLESHGIRFISRVVGITKLKGKFKPFEARRMLLKENGLFLADERVVPLLPGLLGKKFFDAKKQPIPVSLTRKDLKGTLERAISSTYFHQNQGTCSSVKVGTVSQKPEQVLANLTMALPTIVKNIKGGWDNIQSLHIKTSSSTSLPVWTCELGSGEGARWDGLTVGAEEDGSEEASDDEMEVDEKEEKGEKGNGRKRAAEEPGDDKPKKKAKAAPEEASTDKPVPKKVKDAKAPHQNSEGSSASPVVQSATTSISPVGPIPKKRKAPASAEDQGKVIPAVTQASAPAPKDEPGKKTKKRSKEHKLEGSADEPSAGPSPSSAPSVPAETASSTATSQPAPSAQSAEPASQEVSAEKKRKRSKDSKPGSTAAVEAPLGPSPSSLPPTSADNSTVAPQPAAPAPSAEPAVQNEARKNRKKRTNERKSQRAADELLSATSPTAAVPAPADDPTSAVTAEPAAAAPSAEAAKDESGKKRKKRSKEQKPEGPAEGPSSGPSPSAPSAPSDDTAPAVSSQPAAEETAQTASEAAPAKKRRKKARGDTVAEVPDTRLAEVEAQAAAPITPKVPKRPLAVHFFDDVEATPAQVAPPPNTPADGLSTCTSGKKRRKDKAAAVADSPFTSAIAKLATEVAPSTPATAEKEDIAPVDTEMGSATKTRKPRHKKRAADAQIAAPEGEVEVSSPAPVADKSAHTPKELKEKRRDEGVEKKKEKMLKRKKGGDGPKDALIGKKGL